MSEQYDRYLEQHKSNVAKGYEYIRDNIPSLLHLSDIDEPEDYEWQICFNHDQSKSDPQEYHAYDAYFYGGNRSYSVVKNFERAWLHHIHMNPHHWQYWILINDEPDEAETILDMDYGYIIEMVCDWWAFSWAKGNLYEIFEWYEKHGPYMKLSDKTRSTVEHILDTIKEHLDNKEKTNERE